MRKSPGLLAPRIFGRGVREHVLVLLNNNGPLQTQQIVDIVGCEEKRVRRTLRHFESLGVTVQRGVKGHRKRWTIDRRFIAYDELRKVLATLRRFWSAPRLDVPAKRFGGPDFRLRRANDPAIDNLFGSPARTRVLLAIACGAGQNMEQLANSSAVRYESVVYIVNALERDKLANTTRSGRDRRVQINTQIELGRRLEDLLSAIALHFRLGNL